ncbi:unnamed protein product [Linum tenue]|uniref:Uncharacterized protein n=1 Tax=Linum tenue TaxID=586396 RepID=A0AAV0PW11_9ROSI|nr:unnamed protein product [Linum tenue]
MVTRVIPRFLARCRPLPPAAPRMRREVRPPPIPPTAPSSPSPSGDELKLLPTTRSNGDELKPPLLSVTN